MNKRSYRVLILCMFLKCIFVKSAKLIINNEEVNITRFGPEIDGSTINYEVTNLRIIYTQKFEEHVDTIKNFEKLNKFTILQEPNQEHVPIFINVPVLQRIDVVSTDITYLTQKSFENTKIVNYYMKNNKISTIERHAFAPDTVIVSLACNRLKRFNSRWFSNLEILKILNLRGNLIEEIQENAFVGFKELGDINLSYNKIHTVGAGAFAHRRKFDWLYLNDNQLKVINPDMFDLSGDEPLVMYAFFYQNNNLTFIPKTIREKVQLYVSILSGNPWQCACYHLLRQWFKWERYGTFYSPKDPDGEPRCIRPKSFAEQCVELEDAELRESYWNATTKPITREKLCECTAGTNPDRVLPEECKTV